MKALSLSTIATGVMLLNTQYLGIAIFLIICGIALAVWNSSQDDLGNTDTK